MSATPHGPMESRIVLLLKIFLWLASGVALLFVGLFAFTLVVYAVGRNEDPKTRANDFVVDYFAANVPSSLRLVHVWNEEDATFSGDGEKCSLAYTMDAAAFGPLLSGHHWAVDAPMNTKAFRATWPDDQGDLEGYSYADAKSTHTTHITASKDHTRVILDVSDIF